jgi:hypothetical protein
MRPVMMRADIVTMMLLPAPPKKKIVACFTLDTLVPAHYAVSLRLIRFGSFGFQHHPPGWMWGPWSVEYAGYEGGAGRQACPAAAKQK